MTCTCLAALERELTLAGEAKYDSSDYVTFNTLISAIRAAAEQNTGQVETWLPVPSNPRYKVSTAGNVIGPLGIIMKGSKDKDGYLYLALFLPNRSRQFRRIHTLVAEAFIGPRPAGMYVAHRNGHNDDNRLENIYYATPKENCADMFRHGRDCIGERAYCSKLKLADVVCIASETNRSDQNAREVAAKYGVSSSSVHNIWQGRTWVKALKNVGITSAVGAQ